MTLLTQKRKKLAKKGKMIEQAFEGRLNEAIIISLLENRSFDLLPFGFDIMRKSIVSKKCLGTKFVGKKIFNLSRAVSRSPAFNGSLFNYSPESDTTPGVSSGSYSSNLGGESSEYTRTSCISKIFLLLVIFSTLYANVHLANSESIAEQTIAHLAATNKKLTEMLHVDYQITAKARQVPVKLNKLRRIQCLGRKLSYEMNSLCHELDNVIFDLMVVNEKCPTADKSSEYADEVSLAATDLIPFATLPIEYLLYQTEDVNAKALATAEGSSSAGEYSPKRTGSCPATTHQIEDVSKSKLSDIVPTGQNSVVTEASQVITNINSAPMQQCESIVAQIQDTTDQRRDVSAQSQVIDEQMQAAPKQSSVASSDVIEHCSATSEQLTRNIRLFCQTDEQSSRPITRGQYQDLPDFQSSIGSNNEANLRSATGVAIASSVSQSFNISENGKTSADNAGWCPPSELDYEKNRRKLNEESENNDSRENQESSERERNREGRSLNAILDADGNGAAFDESEVRNSDANMLQRQNIADITIVLFTDILVFMLSYLPIEAFELKVVAHLPVFTNESSIFTIMLSFLTNLIMLLILIKYVVHIVKALLIVLGARVLRRPVNLRSPIQVEDDSPVIDSERMIDLSAVPANSTPLQATVSPSSTWSPSELNLRMSSSTIPDGVLGIIEIRTLPVQLNLPINPAPIPQAQPPPGSLNPRPPTLHPAPPPQPLDRPPTTRVCGAQGSPVKLMV